MNEFDAVSKAAEALACRRQRCGVTIDPKKSQTRVGLEHRGRVAAATDGPVDVEPSGLVTEQFDDLVE